MSLRIPFFGNSRRAVTQRRARRLTVESLETRRLLAIIHVNDLTGDDVAGDGSEATPFLTIGKGITEAVANDEIRIAAGDYDEAVNVNKTLTLNATGNVVANSWTSAAANTVTLEGAFLADTNFVFNGPALVRAATQLVGFNVEFLGTLNAAAAVPAPSLAVNAGTLARFGNGVADNVGAIDELASLTVGPGGVTSIGAAHVNTNGSTITFNNPVVLAADLTINELGAGDVTFVSTVDSDATPRTLAVNTIGGGTTRFGGSVGVGSALSSLTTDQPGATNVAGGAVTTTSNQTYNDNVELEQDATLTGATVSLLEDINSLVLASPRGLTVNAATATNIGDAAGDVVGVPRPLSSLTIGGGGANIRAGTIATNGSTITFNSPVVLNANTIITEAGAGNVSFLSTIDSDATPRSLTVNTTGGGNTIFAGAIGATSRLSALTTDLLGQTQMGAINLRTNGATVTFNDPVVLTNDLTIDEIGAGAVTFNNTIDSDATLRSLTVNTVGGGNTVFAGAIGVSSRLRVLTTDLPGTTRIGAPNINTNGATITFNDPVVLTNDLTIDELGAGAVTFNNTINSDATLRSLSVNTAAGATVFNGAIGGTSRLRALTTDASGTTFIGAQNINTNGATITFNDPVVLTADTIIDEVGPGNVSFNSMVDSDGTPRDLTVGTAAGVTLFAGAVGGASPLDDLTTDKDGTTSITGGSVTTTGTQDYNDAVSITSATNLTTFTGANVRFDSALDAGAANQDAQINSPGLTRFGGAVGATTPPRDLTSDAPGTTAIEGGLVATSATQTYNDPVTFTSATNLTTLTGVTVLFNSTLNAGAVNQSLTINASGVTRFGDDAGDNVGAVQPPRNLTTDAAGTTRITATTVTTTNNQNFLDPVLLANDVTTQSQGENVFFGQTVDGFDDGNAATFFSLTVIRLLGNTDVIFAGNVGDPAPATGGPQDLQFVSVLTNGPLRLVADITTLDNILINLVEGGAASVTDDLTVEAASGLSAGQDITLNVGDDITFAPGSSAEAIAGDLLITGDFGNNDLLQGTLISVLGTTGQLAAGGLVRLIGGPDDDFFNVQLSRLRVGDNILVNGAGNGTATYVLQTDTATLAPGCNVNLAAASVTVQPFGDSLNLFDNDQAVGRVYDLNSTQLTRSGGLIVQFLEVQQFELQAGSGSDQFIAQMPGLPTVVQFNGGPNPGGTADQLDVIGSAAADQITVGAITDVSPHRPFEIANVETLRVRAGGGNDIVVNGVGVPSLLEGQAGDDILVGGPAVDVIFGGAGGDDLFGLNGGDALFPDHEFDGSVTGILTIDDGDVSAGGEPIFFPGDSAVPLNSPAVTPATLDFVCGIERLVDGGASKDVLTWLNAQILPNTPASIETLMRAALEDLQDAEFIIDPPIQAFIAPAPIANPDFDHWLDNLYQALLGRDFAPSEHDYYANASAAGATRDNIAQGFLNSPERRGNIVDDWYDRYLGRSLDAGGRAYWLSVWAQFDGEAVEAGILGSGEFFGRVGGTNQSWVEAMYAQVLGRAGGSGEIQFWVNRAATTSRALLAKQFVTSDEHRLFAVASWYRNYLGRDAEAGGASFWLNKLKTNLKPESIQSSILQSLEFQQMPW